MALARASVGVSLGDESAAGLTPQLKWERHPGQWWGGVENSGPKFRLYGPWIGGGLLTVGGEGNPVLRLRVWASSGQLVPIGTYAETVPGGLVELTDGQPARTEYPITEGFEIVSAASASGLITMGDDTGLSVDQYGQLRYIAGDGADTTTAAVIRYTTSYRLYRWELPEDHDPQQFHRPTIWAHLDGASAKHQMEAADVDDEPGSTARVLTVFRRIITTHDGRGTFEEPPGWPDVDANPYPAPYDIIEGPDPEDHTEYEAVAEVWELDKKGRLRPNTRPSPRFGSWTKRGGCGRQSNRSSCISPMSTATITSRITGECDFHRLLREANTKNFSRIFPKQQQ